MKMIVAQPKSTERAETCVWLLAFQEARDLNVRSRKFESWKFSANFLIKLSPYFLCQTYS